MRILYAIQGTGNGHLSRARAIIPLLRQHGELDLLVSGRQADVQLPEPVRFQLYGMSFTFGKKGGVDMLDTLLKTNFYRFWRDARRLPLQNYDLIINDFEPLTAWGCKWRGIPSVALSHQSGVIHPKAPRPMKKDPLGHTILHHYAPATNYYGFHFKPYGERVFTPVIRQGIRALEPCKHGHYTVYLPAIGDELLIRVLRQVEVPWHVFSKHTKDAYRRANVQVSPVDNDAFVRSLESCTGVLCGAGFEAPAEALFLGKKLAVVPMTNQYEQHCNAAALREMGVPVLPAFSDKQVPQLQDWVEHQRPIQVHYPDETAAVIARVVRENA